MKTTISLLAIMIATFSSINLFSMNEKVTEEGTKSSEKNLKVVSIPALRNPDRGYHTESIFIVPRGINPFRRQAQPPFNKNTFKILEKKFKAEADSVTLVQQYFYLIDYVEKDIDKKAYDFMESVFKQMLEDDYDAILRFAYNHKCVTNPTYENEEMIMRHIHQLTPFVRENIGQFAALQSGFFGACGEWHSSLLYGNRAFKDRLINALLEMVPEPYCVQIRYPVQVRKMTLPSNSEAKRIRIGYNNDYFTAGEHPLAKYNDYVDEDYDFVKEEVRKNNPFICAEIPYSGNTEWNLNSLINNPDHVLQILQEHRYSAFDITQNYDINLPYWKTISVSRSHLDSLNIRYDSRYFDNEDGEEVRRSFYQFVRDHLGYRINLKEGAKIRRCGHNLKYDFTLTNSGFARPMYPGEAYLVLLKDNKICEKILLTDNIREWLPMTKEDESVMAEYRYEGKVKMKGLKGNYKVGIWIPKTNEKVRYRAGQNIKMAQNNNVEHLWINGQYAINVIGELKF